MNEKRFTLLKELCREDMTKSYVTIYDIDSKQQYVNLTEIVNLCNSLNGENEQLQKLLNEAEDLIESRLAEHYVKQYRNIKESIVNE